MSLLRARWWFALRARTQALREKHERAFWIAHSLWALAQGVAVAVLAEERPDYGAWVFALLALVWLTTLFFCRSALVAARPASFRVGFASYATRVLYQQTLFFVLPFYVRSTTPSSLNLAFTLALGALAAFACLDLSFDRWLRRSPAFAAIFFFAVAYAALQLLLPLAARVPFAHAHPLAIGLALTASIASLGLARGPARGVRWLGALPVAALAIALLAAPLLIPPAPLRVAAFGVEARGDVLRATVHVAAPVPVPVGITLQWERGRERLRVSRGVAITAHEGGFRVWDELSRARLASAAPGADAGLHVDVLTETGQLVGRRALPPIGVGPEPTERANERGL
jgi:hypothetical protein